MEEINLKKLAKEFWNRKKIVVVILFICMIAGGIYSYTVLKPVYRSSASLVLAKTGGNETTENSITQTDVTLNQKLVATYSELIKSKNVLRQVISNLQIPDLQEDDLRKAITVTSVTDTELIKISVVNADAAKAMRIANEITNVFSEKVAQIYNINNVYIVDKAQVSTQPSNINHPKDLLIAFVVGMMISIFYIVIRNMFDTTIKSVEDVTQNSGLIVLAQIPKYEFEKKEKDRKSK